MQTLSSEADEHVHASFDPSQTPRQRESSGTFQDSTPDLGTPVDSGTSPDSVPVDCLPSCTPSLSPARSHPPPNLGAPGRPRLPRRILRGRRGRAVGETRNDIELTPPEKIRSILVECSNPLCDCSKFILCASFLDCAD